jgi:hypothetical protein
MYGVRWTKSAREELASAWVDADSTQRAAITAAAVKIDEVLQSSAHEFGESRVNDRRIGFVPPLGFVFSVNDELRRVKVLHIWAI